MTIVISAFYKFEHLPDYQDLRRKLREYCEAAEIRGSILLAEEGINGTIAGSREGINKVIAYLRSDTRLSDLETKESFADYIPFKRMKVRLKKEIVTLKAPADPRAVVGTYVDPDEWNRLISDPEVLVIDTRNDYEYKMGTFKNAVNPHTESFGEFTEYVQDRLADHKDKKIAMFCTGGIRCEKATSYLKQQGFDEVYHLQGGILRYLAATPQDTSLWDGDCFVFDERIGVNHDLAPIEGYLCPQCQTFYHDQDVCLTCESEEITQSEA